jgi:hypothetical protein
VFVYVKNQGIYLLDFHCNSREESPVLTEAEITMVNPSETDRQSDAMAVQRAFNTTGKVKKMLKF